MHLMLIHFLDSKAKIKNISGEVTVQYVRSIVKKGGENNCCLAKTAVNAWMTKAVGVVFHFQLTPCLCFGATNSIRINVSNEPK